MLFGVFGLVVAGAVLGATSLRTVPEVIQAKKFEVVNESGLVVGTFQSWEDRGLISLRDSKKRPTVVISSELSTGGASGYLTTMNSKGAMIASVGVDESGSGLIATEDGQGVRLVEVGSDSRGGRIDINNKKGGGLVNLGSNANGTGFISTENSEGKTQVKISAVDGGGGAITTGNGRGDEFVEISYGTNRSGFIRVKDRSSSTLVDIGESQLFKGGMFKTYASKSSLPLTYVGANGDGSGLVVTLDKQEVTSSMPSASP
tara:strand:+ start:1225 stop:2004 length:780 start_codon:yes stop_codon:yes gene_type:complete